MEFEEFASLQLDKPLPIVRVCNIYILLKNNVLAKAFENFLFY